MLSALFPLVYGSIFVFLLIQAFRMMRLNPGVANSARRTDRTGLLTTHPELLDANGSITGEDLLVVRFPSQDQSEASMTDWREPGCIQNEEPLSEPMTLNHFFIFLVMGIALAVITSANWIWWILAICTTLVVIKLLKKWFLAYNANSTNSNQLGKSSYDCSHY